MVISKLHSAVCYIYDSEKGFEAVEKGRSVSNDLGLDLFRYKGYIYEGQTGIKLCKEDYLEESFRRLKNGELESVKSDIEQYIQKNGLSPRYTRPDEKKSEVFPAKEKDENIVFAKDLTGKKHYFYRFYHENGIELFTLNRQKDFFATVYIPCDGYMVGFDQKHRLEDILKRIATFENGIRGEIERIFNESMKNPEQYAHMGFARLLGRMEEAAEHNAPIEKARDIEDERRQAERIEQNRREEMEREKEYQDAIEKAEKRLLSGKVIDNERIHGKSLVLQLFREHGIDVPLRTQGWINNSLLRFRYEHTSGKVYLQNYHKASDTFVCAVPHLYDAVLTKQQFLETACDEETGVAEEVSSDYGIEP